MPKVHVGFNVDLGKLNPEAFEGVVDTQEFVDVAEETIKAMLLGFARRQALADLRDAQRDPTLTKEQKATRMAAALRKSMLTLQAEANLDVTILPEDTVIPTEHPAELAA